jgi:N-acetylmuramoyl-L-alanine amidase
MAKVFLSAGHGGSDPGAVGNGLKEKDINLQTLLVCKEILEKHGVEVVASRTKDENDPVGQEVKEANASKADVAVSFHVNAGGGDGFEAFYHTSSSKGKKLATLGEKYVKAMGQNSRGIKSGNHLYFVKNTDMTAVLFESFFIDSKDKAIGDTLAEQKAFGVAYAKAILEYLGIAYNATTTTASKAETTEAKKTNTIYRVQVGAYGVKSNAEAMQRKLKAAGFDAYITTK